MNRPPKQLEEMLRKRGLSPAYAKRMVVELRDHLECTTLEYIEGGYPEDTAARLAHERLGHDDLILEHVSSDPSSLVLPHQHPFLSFFAGPIVAVGFALAMYVSVASRAAEVATHAFGLEATDQSFHLFARVLYYCAGYLLWLLAALVVCAVAHRYRCGIRCSLLGCLTLAGMAGLSYVYMKLPVGDTGTEIVAYGVHLASRIPRIILPLIVFAFFAGYETRSKGLAN